MVNRWFAHREFATRGFSRWKLLVAALGLSGMMAACGPVMSSQELSDARRAVERASSRDADERAVYEFTLATAYLEKAREEWAYNRYQMARAYAVLAQEHAEAALRRIEERLGPGEGGER